ncbi:hypothetical protein PMI28_05749 [Pseudomonas sp. GM48]|nr:hypothetical protein PMI28_05749 [Pseudomonas sp. GM48]
MGPVSYWNRGELADQELFLEWFYRPSSGNVAPMMLNFNRQSESFYNYQSMPWFTRPKLTGEASVEANSANWFVGNMASRPAAAKVHKLKPLSIERSLVEPPVPR